MATTIQTLVRYMEEELDTARFKAIDTINGLQVARKNSEVQRIAVAVDSSLSSIEKAAELGADVLLVHHGLLWGQLNPIVESLHAKISTLLHHDIALCAFHLPLDAHMDYGNNAQLAKVLGLQDVKPYGMYKGQYIGVCGTYPSAVPRDQVVAKLFPPQAWGQATPQGAKSETKEQARAMPYLNRYKLENVDVGTAQEQARPLGTAFHGSELIQKVAIVSGGITRDLVPEAQTQGVDLHISGDASHLTWLEAQEAKINVLFAGHYFTEVWGVLSLGEQLMNQFSLKGVFIHATTQH